MQHDLDQRLAVAAPGTSSDDPAVRNELAALVATTESASVAARRPQRHWVIGGITAALVLGGATAAVAATVVPWGPVVKLAELRYEAILSSGNACETRVRVLQARGDASQGIEVPSTVREDVAAARELVAQIDVGSLDIEAARDYLIAHDMVSSASSGDVVELQAYDQAVLSELQRLMAAEGANRESITTQGETHCERTL